MFRLPSIGAAWEYRDMNFESCEERPERPEAGDGRRAPDAARTNAVAAGGEPAAAALAVGPEGVSVGGVDIAPVRAALAQLGAHGASSLEELSPQQAIALLDELEKVTGAVAAVQARALVHLEAAVHADSLARGETRRQARAVARAEASAVLRRSTSAAGQTMSSSRRLVASMPGLLTALAQGRMVPASSHTVGRVMAPATPEQRRQVDAVLTAHLAHLEACGPQQWGDEAERVLHALDPEGAAARHQKTRRERSVTVRRGRYGMATLTAHVSGIDGARIRKGLSVAAEKARAGGDRRGHQQIMADLFADALIGRGNGVDPSTLDIGVLITDRSLLAPRHADSATVEGIGSVPYDHVREEMLRALDGAGDEELALTLRRLYVDMEDGQLTAVESRAREFPAGMARQLRLAHQTCRAPHCEASIRQIDHIVPWSEGGRTTLENGNGLCAADNQKELAGERARVLTDENGVRRTVEWRTRYGQVRRRGGVNFDPLGTAARRAARRAAQEPEPAVAARDAGPAADPAPTPAPEPVPTCEPPPGRTLVDALRHALAQVDSAAQDLPEDRPAAPHVSPAAPGDSTAAARRGRWRADVIAPCVLPAPRRRPPRSARG